MGEPHPPTPRVCELRPTTRHCGRGGCLLVGYTLLRSRYDISHCGVHARPSLHNRRNMYSVEWLTIRLPFHCWMQVHVQTNAYSSADKHRLHGVACWRISDGSRQCPLKPYFASVTGAKDHVLPYPQPLGQAIWLMKVERDNDILVKRVVIPAVSDAPLTYTGASPCEIRAASSRDAFPGKQWANLLARFS